MAEISVSLASFNGEKYIGRQIETILNQTVPPDEIIISDDGSQDSTIEIAKKFGPKIKIFKNPGKGLVCNFENAIKNSSGKFIFLSDQDDEWKKEKIEKVLKILEKSPLCNHDAEIIDENSNLITNKSFFLLRGSRPGILKNLYKSTYLGCCIAFRREILDLALPFPENIETHDRWLGLIGELYGGADFFPEKLLRYRRHKENASGGFEKSRYNRREQFSIRFVMAKNLAFRYALKLMGKKSKI